MKSKTVDNEATQSQTLHIHSSVTTMMIPTVNIEIELHTVYSDKFEPTSHKL